MYSNTKRNVIYALVVVCFVPVTKPIVKENHRRCFVDSSAANRNACKKVKMMFQTDEWFSTNQLGDFRSKIN